MNFSLSMSKDAYSSSMEALSVNDRQTYKARETYDLYHRLLTGCPVVLTGQEKKAPMMEKYKLTPISSLGFPL